MIPEFDEFSESHLAKTQLCSQAILSLQIGFCTNYRPNSLTPVRAYNALGF